MNALKIYPLLLIAAFLCACASTEVRDNLAKAEISYAQIVDEVMALRDEGVIEPGSDTEQRVVEALETINEALNQANLAVKEGDTESAGTWVRAALRGISSVARQLEAANG